MFFSNVPVLDMLLHVLRCMTVYNVLKWLVCNCMIMQNKKGEGGVKREAQKMVGLATHRAHYGLPNGLPKTLDIILVNYIKVQGTKNNRKVLSFLDKRWCLGGGEEDHEN